MPDCIFCQIVEGKLPSTKEYEDGQFLAFRNINPAYDTHVLVTPKKHIDDLSAVSDSDLETVGRMALIARDLAQKLGIVSGYKLVMNAGSFPLVHHIHFHLMGGKPRKGGIV